MTDEQTPGQEKRQPAAETGAPRVRRGRRAAMAGIRAGVATVGLALAAALIGAASLLSLPEARLSPPSTAITPVPAAQERLCPGPLLTLDDSVGADSSTVRSHGSPKLSYSATAGEVQKDELKESDDKEGRAPVLLTLPAGGPGEGPLLAGSQSQQTKTKALSGFAAADCAGPSSDSWLVGGATTTGRTTLVLLSNPTDVSATVRLTIYSENGIVAAAAAEGIVVAAGSQRILPLSGFAPGIASPVVHVESSGGQVVASLEQSVIRTLTPGGVDLVDATSAPAAVTTIPGVVLRNTQARLTQASEPGYQDLQTVLRILAPGKADSEATVSIGTEAGGDGGAAAEPVTFSLTLTAGRVTDIPIDMLGDGDYTVTVTSKEPAVAAVRISTVGDSGAIDFAWLAGAPTLTDRAHIAVADGPSPRLHLANPTDVAATVSVARAQGTSEVTVPARSTVAIAAVAGGHYTLSGFAELLVAVSYAGDGALAGFVVHPPAAAPTPVVVYR